MKVIFINCIFIFVNCSNGRWILPNGSIIIRKNTCILENRNIISQEIELKIFNRNNLII